MRRVKSKGSKLETLLQKRLWHRGITTLDKIRVCCCDKGDEENSGKKHQCVPRFTGMKLKIIIADHIKIITWDNRICP
jgi:hypothetical protein